MISATSTAIQSFHGQPPVVAPAEQDAKISFRDFLLFPRARLLLKNGRPVELGSRAFDLLHALAAARGTLVTKDELIRRVWPNLFVEECNLKAQVARLRRSLGDDGDLIKTIAGRGYMLAEEVDDTPVARAVPELASDQADFEDPGDRLRTLLLVVMMELWQLTPQDNAPRSGAS